MKPQKTDRRIQRTQEALRNALVELILEKGYPKITVQNIIDRANVGRSTFYAHFLDKDDLLVSGFHAWVFDLSRTVEDHAQIQSDRHIIHSQDFFAHADHHRDLYRAMLESGGGDLILKIGQEHIQQQIEVHLHELIGKQEFPIPLPFITHYLAGALLSLIKWWVEEDIPFNATQMDAMFQAMAMPGIQEVIMGDGNH
jgi:AcrR family transcriptional regulator